MIRACNSCVNPEAQNSDLLVSEFIVSPTPDGMIRLRAVSTNGAILADIEFCRHDSIDVALHLESVRQLITEAS